MTRKLRLNLLTPHIIEAIFEGQQGPDATLARLMKPYVAEWARQRAKGSGLPESIVARPQAAAQ